MCSRVSAGALPRVGPAGTFPWCNAAGFAWYPLSLSLARHRPHLVPAHRPREPFAPNRTRTSTVSTKAYAAQSATSPLAPFTLRRRDPLPTDVRDRHPVLRGVPLRPAPVRNEWSEFAPTAYPCVPGHEIVGRVTKVGKDVKKFKEGDLAAVGCMVDSCRTCPGCRRGLEQYCERSLDPHLQQPGQALGRRHLRRVLRRDRGRRGVRPEVSGKVEPGRHRPAVVRRDHDVLPAAALEGRAGAEGGGRRPRRAGAHGGEVRPGVRGARRPVHHLAGQNRRREAARGARGGGVEEPERDEGARLQLRLHPGRGVGRPRRQRVPVAAQARRHAVPGRGAGRSRCR